jgi:REP element-mobilizing transposase RayT
MARPYRLQAENCLYHITSRGDDRKPIFKSERDYEKFLEYIKTVKEKFKIYLYSYCLMSNHYHLLIETTQANISRAMHYLNTSYTVYYNVKRKKHGHIFQGRYKSIVVDADSYLQKLTRYIHLNPVRAKIVQSPEKYRWSSYNEFIGQTKQQLIDKPQLQRYVKLSTGKYKKFVKKGINESINPFKELYAGFILGKEGFIRDTLDMLKLQVESQDIAYKDMLCVIEPNKIIEKIAQYYKQNPEILRKAVKKPLLAKKIAVYLLKQLTALSNKEIGQMFGISYSAVSKIVKNIESLKLQDRRVNKDAEALISHFKG